MKTTNKVQKEDQGELIIQFGGGTLRLPINIPELDKKIIEEQKAKEEEK